MTPLRKIGLVAGFSFVSAMCLLRHASAGELCTVQSLSNVMTASFLSAINSEPAADRPTTLAFLRQVQQSKAEQAKFLAGFRSKVPDCQDNIILQALGETIDDVEAREH